MQILAHTVVQNVEDMGVHGSRFCRSGWHGLICRCLICNCLIWIVEAHGLHSTCWARGRGGLLAPPPTNLNFSGLSRLTNA